MAYHHKPVDVVLAETPDHEDRVLEDGEAPPSSDMQSLDGYIKYKTSSRIRSKLLRQKVTEKSNAYPEIVSTSGSTKDDRDLQQRAFIRNIPEGIDNQMLRYALSKVSEVAYVDINRRKRCAFVNFLTMRALQAALDANPHDVAGAELFVEERTATGDSQLRLNTPSRRVLPSSSADWTPTSNRSSAISISPYSPNENNLIYPGNVPFRSKTHGNGDISVFHYRDIEKAFRFLGRIPVRLAPLYIKEVKRMCSDPSYRDADQAIQARVMEPKIVALVKFLTQQTSEFIPSNSKSQKLPFAAGDSKPSQLNADQGLARSHEWHPRTQVLSASFTEPTESISQLKDNVAARLVAAEAFQPHVTRSGHRDHDRKLGVQDLTTSGDTLHSGESSMFLPITYPLAKDINTALPKNWKLESLRHMQPNYPGIVFGEAGSFGRCQSGGPVLPTGSATSRNCLTQTDDDNEPGPNCSRATQNTVGINNVTASYASPGHDHNHSGSSDEFHSPDIDVPPSVLRSNFSYELQLARKAMNDQESAHIAYGEQLDRWWNSGRSRVQQQERAAENLIRNTTSLKATRGLDDITPIIVAQAFIPLLDHIFSSTIGPKDARRYMTSYVDPPASALDKNEKPGPWRSFFEPF